VANAALLRKQAHEDDSSGVLIVHVFALLAAKVMIASAGKV
jgi:hypothetical protein